ncbi:hypothetical protein LZ31DRAFT_618034 [Colletotrichum somersetense]|nr:hypothetical protein LZ31DRAFT_618034 [Colletotrichum somersetense]
MPGAAIRGGLVSRLGSCKPIHHFSWAIALFGLSLSALMDRDSSTEDWTGSASRLSSPWELACWSPGSSQHSWPRLSESGTALTTAAWSFVRSFEMVWGDHPCHYLQHPLRRSGSRACPECRNLSSHVRGPGILTRHFRVSRDAVSRCT